MNAEIKKAREILESLIIVSDKEDIRIAKKDKQFATKKNSYDVKTDNIGIAVNMKNKDITWVQMVKEDTMLVETKDCGFWIEMGVR